MKQGRLSIPTSTRTAVLSAVLAAVLVSGISTSGQTAPTETTMRPVISESTSPVVPISPVARDGYRGEGYLRKPPGDGPFPAVVWIHGGLTTRPSETVRQYTIDVPPLPRFLAEGYVVTAITYRSRDLDPQSTVSRDDSVAAVEYVRQLPYVDPRSVVVYGCSGGGDLALEVAATADVAAIAAEEPALIMFTGLFNSDSPKAGDRFVPGDGLPISSDPEGRYTAEYQRITRAKIGRIQSPILILQGEPAPDLTRPIAQYLNRFNALTVIPELKAAGKTLEVKSYAGEPHCFAFYGQPPQAPRPAVALQAFRDVDAFFRQHLATQPTAIAAEVVEQVPVE